MYIFTSAIFFLIFFNITDPKDNFKITSGDRVLAPAERDSALIETRKEIADDPSNYNLKAKLELLENKSKELKYSDLLPYNLGFVVISPLGRNYKSMEEYDSIQKALPSNKKDGWLKRLWNKRAVSLNDKNRREGFSMKNLGEYILHQLPYFLFFSLPFFALLLKLLYIRRKNFYYADHGIFAIHLYIFNFIALLFIFLLTRLNDSTGWGIWNFLKTVTALAWLVYFFMAMKKFYKQGRMKTFFKLLILAIAGIIMLMVLFLIFSLFAVFQL